MLFDGRLVETVKHTHKGTSLTNRQRQCAPEVHKRTFYAKRNVDSQMPCRVFIDDGIFKRQQLA